MNVAHVLRCLEADKTLKLSVHRQLISVVQSSLAVHVKYDCIRRAEERLRQAYSLRQARVLLARMQNSRLTPVQQRKVVAFKKFYATPVFK